MENKTEKNMSKYWKNVVKKLHNVVDLANTQTDVPLRKNPGRKCKVLFSYEPVNEDELELKVDDIIDILAEIEEGWWKGRLRNKIGVFPSNFVAEISNETRESKPRNLSSSSLDEPAKPVNAMNHDESSSSSVDADVPVLPPKPVKEMCRALFPYEPANEDELLLQKGDIITLLSRDGQDKGWWKGEMKGKIGVFPDNFVEIITSDETKPGRPPIKTNNVTTNRVRDTITKPSVSSSSSTTSLVSAHRKSIELPPKPDEKLSPPGVGKKPVLPPPPLKKTVGSRSPNSSVVNKTLNSTSNYAAETKPILTTPPKSQESPTNSTSGARLPLTNLTASLKQSVSTSDVSSTHTETSKVPTMTGPKRSESSDSADGSFFSRSSASYSLINHSMSESTEQIKSTEDVDLDCVGRNAMLTHPTASRAKAPRRRPPSTINTKENSETSVVMNGNAEPPIDIEKNNRASFVQELKMSQAKKNSALVGTRVMISSSTSNTESSSVVESTKISPGVTLRNLPGHFPRPHSMLGGSSMLSGGNSINRGIQIPFMPPETVTVSSKQFTELIEKISRLESQHETYQQAIKDLNNKLNEEVERRLQMQLEIEKLTDLVTQVPTT